MIQLILVHFPEIILASTFNILPHSKLCSFFSSQRKNLLNIPFPIARGASKASQTFVIVFLKEASFSLFCTKINRNSLPCKNKCVYFYDVNSLEVDTIGSWTAVFDGRKQKIGRRETRDLPTIGRFWGCASRWTRNQTRPWRHIVFKLEDTKTNSASAASKCPRMSKKHYFQINPTTLSTGFFWEIKTLTRHSRQTAGFLKVGLQRLN